MFCAWSPLSRCLSPAPARCPRLWSCGSSLVAPSRCGCCASFPLCVAEKWQNQQVFLLKLVGSGCSDGWCGRQGSGAAVCRKKCSPGLVPPRLIGHVFLPFFMAPIAYLHGHNPLEIHSPRPIYSGRRPRRRRPIIYLPNHTNLCSGSCFFGSLVMHNHG